MQLPLEATTRILSLRGALFATKQSPPTLKSTDLASLTALGIALLIGAVLGGGWYLLDRKQKT